MDDGRDVELYTLCGGGLEVGIMTYGGIIQSLRVPDREGHVANIVLGFPDLSSYVRAGNTYLGAIVGRYANRIANARFMLDGSLHRLECNEGLNHLHGGQSGFDKKVWAARTHISDSRVAVALSHTSQAGSEGYPGELHAEVVYALDTGGVFRIDYRATTTSPTVLSLTNHSLFNLAGEGAGSVLSHTLQIGAERFTPVDDQMIPTGHLAEVAGTPFDFRDPVEIGAFIHEAHEQLVVGQGYDHNFVLHPPPASSGLRCAARLVDARSGRTLELSTTEPGLQLYTGNRLDGTLTGAGGRRYERFGGVALEAQRFPDSPNNSHFPSSVLRPGELYESATELRFAWPRRTESTC